MMKIIENRPSVWKRIKNLWKHDNIWELRVEIDDPSDFVVGVEYLTKYWGGKAGGSKKRIIWGRKYVSKLMRDHYAKYIYDARQTLQLKMQYGMDAQIWDATNVLKQEMLQIIFDKMNCSAEDTQIKIKSNTMIVRKDGKTFVIMLPAESGEEE